ncbi:MAG: phosphodiesterase [Methylobacteriaceae bacterium]|nr:phosphodiesterase [Methylobacteriaceae bacterium]
MLIAQITDLHVRPPGQAAYRVSETNMMAARAIEAVAALRPAPDLVVVTGDMTDCGLPAEYELLRALLRRLPCSALMVPGNHDRREHFRAAFPDHPAMGASGFVQFAVDHGPVRVIGLDTVVPGSSEGALCADRLAFLEEALAAAPERPTLILMHHPPFDCGSAAMDRIGLKRGVEELGAIVARHSQVERILCGHHHRPIVTRFAGTIASVAPGVAHQVELDLGETGRGMLVFEPPAYELHLHRPGAGFVSHMAYVERFPGPFPFVLDPDYPGAS